MSKILEIINIAASAEHFIGSQFLYFVEHGGYEIHLVCSNGSHLASFAEKNKIKYKAIPINRNITPIRDLKSLVEICKYIKKNRFDIIICHQEKGNLLGQLAGAIMGIPIRIMLAHGVLYESMHGFKRWIIWLQDKFVAKLATNVVCVSNFVRDTRIKDGIDKSYKSIVLGCGSCNGIDVKKRFNPYNYDLNSRTLMREQFGISESDFVIGFCGRLVKDKGIEELVESHKILVKRYPEMKIWLFVIGQLEHRDAISQEAANYLQNNENVIFTGAVHYDEIPQYYYPMDVFVLPSHREGLGMVALEAQAMEVPAIVTDFTGCAETIQNGITGEYIDLNPVNIAETISHFFDKSRATQFGKQGRAFVSCNFDNEIVNNNLLEYVNSLQADKTNQKRTK